MSIKKLRKIDMFLYILALVCPLIILNFSPSAGVTIVMYGLIATAIGINHKKPMVVGFVVMTILYGLYVSFGFKSGISAKYVEDGENTKTFFPFFISNILICLSFFSMAIFVAKLTYAQIGKVWWIPGVLFATGWVVFYAVRYAVVKPEINSVYAMVVDIIGNALATAAIFLNMYWVAREGDEI